MDPQVIRQSKLYSLIGERHPSFLFVADFVGDDRVLQMVSTKLDDNGALLPPDEFERMFRILPEAEDRPSAMADYLWLALIKEAIDLWILRLTKDQADTLCSAIGYYGTITLFPGVEVLVCNIPMYWSNSHPGEYLQASKEWSTPIA